MDSPPQSGPFVATHRALRLSEILENIAHWTEPSEAIQCIRVCRQWHSHFLAIVWRSLALLRHDILEAPHDSIVAAHGPLVQDLALYIYPKEDAEVLSRLHVFATHMARLQELKFRIVGGTDSYFGIAQAWLSSNRKSLRRFCWSTTRDARKPNRILEAVNHFPSTAIGGGDRDSSGGEGGGMERLQDLTLEGWDLTMANLGHLLRACPRLSSLSLHRNHFLDHEQQEDDDADGQSLPTTLPPAGQDGPNALQQHSSLISSNAMVVHPGVRELNTEGEIPAVILECFPNLEQWTARDVAELDGGRLAQLIQGSNMCSTLTCLDVQRAFSPEMMNDGEDQEEIDGDIQGDEGSNDGEYNNIHNQAVLPVNNTGLEGGNVTNGGADGGAGGDTMTSTIDMVPVLRAIHKDTLKTFRLSRCMLSSAGVRALWEQHGQSLNYISLEYSRKRRRTSGLSPSLQNNTAISSAMSGMSQNDLYLNTILENCPNLVSFRVRQPYNRTYGSIRLLTCSGAVSTKRRRCLAPAWSCKGLRELEVQFDDWHAEAEEIDRLALELGGVPAGCDSPRLIQYKVHRAESDMTEPVAVTLSNENGSSLMIHEHDVALSTLVKARLLTLRHLERINLGTGWFLLV